MMEKRQFTFLPGKTNFELFPLIFHVEIRYEANTRYAMLTTRTNATNRMPKLLLFNKKKQERKETR